MLTYFQILQLVSFAFLMSLGQLLFKKTALSISSEGGLNLYEGIMKAMLVPWLYMALFVYALATVCWLYILQRIPLSIAYPFSALAMIIVPVLAMIVFGERLNYSYWIGLVLILLGISIIGQ